MPQITDLLRDSGGLAAIARELNLDESQAASGAAALLPALLGGFKKQTQSMQGGLEGLGGLLAGLGGGGLMDEVLAPKPTNVNAGNDILGQIFGSKDVSRTVAQNASARSGLDPALLKKMLPVLAMLVAGYMSKQRGGGAAAAPTGGGGLGDVLGGMLGGGGGRQQGGGGLGDVLGGMLGGGGQRAGTSVGGTGGLGDGLGGLASMLDLDGDGNPLDDILGGLGGGKR